MSTSAAPEARGGVPMLVLGAARRRRLETRLGEIARAWHARWGSEGIAEPVVALGYEPASPRAGVITVAALREGEVLMSVSAGTEITRALIGQGASELAGAVGGGACEGLGERLVEGVLRALCDEIHLATFSSRAQVLERRSMPASGNRAVAPHTRTLCACLSIGRGRPIAELILAPEVADALIGARPKVVNRDRLISRRHATREHMVRVRAALGSATVNWRDLTRLAPGDVVVLEQTLDSPSAVIADDGTRIADAQLGSRDGALAVQITRIVQEVNTPHV